jgi:hypothetical protein
MIHLWPPSTGRHDEVSQRIGVDDSRHRERGRLNVPALIYDFKAIGAALHKQRIDDWWQPAKPELESARNRLAKKISLPHCKSAYQWGEPQT